MTLGWLPPELIPQLLVSDIADAISTNRGIFTISAKEIYVSGVYTIRVSNGERCIPKHMIVNFAVYSHFEALTPVLKKHYAFHPLSPNVRRDCNF